MFFVVFLVLWCYGCGFGCVAVSQTSSLFLTITACSGSKSSFPVILPTIRIKEENCFACATRLYSPMWLLENYNCYYHYYFKKRKKKM